MALEAYEKHRNQGLAEMQIFPDQAAQVAAEAKDEAAVRRFLAEKGLLTVPD